jgi:MoaA/NifB/PqqE/SkfB family radical SAM enzyme
MYKYEEIRAVHLELTERCQAACPHCHRFIKEDVLNPNLTMAELSLKDIKSIFPVDFIKQLDSIRLCGLYGEPIIAKDCLEIVQYFKESNPNIFIEISTNAGARSSDWWTRLAKVLAKTDIVNFCIDGLEDTNHIYRKKIKWDIVMNSAKAFISAGGNAVWDFLIFEHNEHQVDDAQELSKQLGFKDIRFKASIRFVSYNNSNETLKPPKNKKYLHDTMFFSSNIKQFNELIEKTNLINCKALKKKEIYITGKGLLLPCCFIAGTLTQAYDNTDKQQIRDIIVNEEFINVKKYSINSILNTGIFNDVKDTWNNSSCLRICKKKCGNIIENNKDVIILDV